MSKKKKEIKKLKCITDNIYSLQSNEHLACRVGKISNTDDEKQLGQLSFKSKKQRCLYRSITVSSTLTPIRGLELNLADSQQRKLILLSQGCGVATFTLELQCLVTSFCFPQPRSLVLISHIHCVVHKAPGDQILSKYMQI